MSLDLKDFFVATTMPKPEYMRVHFKYFPQNIIDKYDLKPKCQMNTSTLKFQRVCMD